MVQPTNQKDFLKVLSGICLIEIRHYLFDSLNMPPDDDSLNDKIDFRLKSGSQRKIRSGFQLDKNKFCFKYIQLLLGVNSVLIIIRIEL